MYAPLTATNNYYVYSEKSQKGKMRYQDQKFFDIGKRLNTWSLNENKFNKEINLKQKTKNTHNDPNYVITRDLF